MRCDRAPVSKEVTAEIHNDQTLKRVLKALVRLVESLNLGKEHPLKGVITEGHLFIGV
jgi:hypothetical protein